MREDFFTINTAADLVVGATGFFSTQPVPARQLWMFVSCVGFYDAVGVTVGARKPAIQIVSAAGLALFSWHTSDTIAAAGNLNLMWGQGTNTDSSAQGGTTRIQVPEFALTAGMTMTVGDGSTAGPVDAVDTMTMQFTFSRHAGEWT